MVKEHALEQKWLFSHYFCHKFDEKVEKYFFQTQRRNLAIYVLDELFTPVHGILISSFSMDDVTCSS